MSAVMGDGGGLLDKPPRPPIIETRGHIVTVTNPLTGKRVTGTTWWVSPTWQTVQVRLDDGALIWTFHDDKAAWWPGQKKVSDRG